MDAGSVTVRIGADISALEKGLLTAQSKLQAVGSKLTSIGKDLALKVTAPVLLLGGVAMHTAVDFDTAMRKVMAVSGATGEQFEELTALARELGRTTEWTASEAAGGMQYLAMAGFKVNDILAAMPGMLDLATAGTLDLATAADIASNILTGFRLKATDIGEVSDIIAKTAANANTNVMQMGEAMSYVAPVAAAAGMSVADTAAAIGLLGNAGIQGSRAGTYLKNILVELLAPSEQFVEQLTAIGLKAEDVDLKTHSFADVLGVLEKKGFNAAMAMDQMGARGGIGLLALMGQGTETIRAFTAEINNATGSTENMADTMRSGPGGAIKTMMSALEDVQIQFGDIIATMLMPFIAKITELANAFSGLDPELQKWIILGAGLAASLGPVLIVVGMLISALGTIAGALAGVGLAPFLAVILAVAAAAWYLYENWDTVSATLMPIIQWFVDTALAAFEGLKKFWEDHGPTITDLIEYMFTVIKKNAEILIRRVWPTIKDFGDFVLEMFEKMNAWWDENGDKILEAVKIVFDTMMSIIMVVLDILLTAFETVWPEIKDVVEGAIDLILGVIELFADIITGDWDEVGKDLEEITNTFMKLMHDAIKGQINFIIATLNKFFDYLSGVTIKVPEFEIPFVGKFGGFDVSMPQIPHIPLLPDAVPMLAAGGIVTEPTLAVIGESGPEAVVPLGSGGIGGNITVNVYESRSPEATAQEIVRILRRRGGITG